MAISKQQKETLELLQKKANEWLSNYYQFGLSTDPNTAAQHSQVLATLHQTQAALAKADQDEPGLEEQGTIPMPEGASEAREAKSDERTAQKAAAEEIEEETEADIANQAKGDADLEATLNGWKDLAVSWLDTGIDKILSTKTGLDKGILATAQEYIGQAEGWLRIASLFTGGELGDKVEKVQGWIDLAKSVIEKVEALDEYLAQWRDLAVSWMEGGISSVVSGTQVVGDLSNAVVAEALDFKKLAQDFVDKAKALGDASLDEKVARAEEWLGSTHNLLDKASDIVDNLFADADNNSLPDWYDLLAREWDKLAVTDIIPGTDIDDAVIAKINDFKAKAEEWLAKATAEINPAVQEKIDLVKTWIYNIQKLFSLAEKGKEFVDALKNKDFNAVYDQLSTLWSELDGANDIFAGTDIDDKLLAKVQEYKQKADEFARIANSLIAKLPAGEHLGEVQDWIKMAMQIATDMANGEDVVGKYIQLAKEWAQGQIKRVLDGQEEFTAEVAGQVSGFVNEAKRFMAAASAMKNGDFSDKVAAAGEWIQSSEGLLDKASDLIGLALGDADGNNLPDWYDRLAAAWDDITGGGDLISNTNVDNELIGKVNIFRTEAEKWLAKAVEVGAEIQEKITMVKQWIEVGGNFLKEVAGFIEDIKEGDYLSVYEKIKAAYLGLGNTDDILEGTEVDNRLLAKAKELQGQAESWLANVLTGGRANGEMTDEVKDILGAVDNVLTFALTKYEVQDSMMEFNEDKIVIDFPNAATLTDEQEAAIIGEFSGGFDGPLVNTLGAVLSRLNQDILTLGSQVDGAYRQTLAAGGASAEVYLKAKSDYESVMKKQKDLMKLLESVRKVVVTSIGLALTPVNPAVAAGVTALLSGSVNGFGDIAKMLLGAAGESGGTLGQIGGFLSLALPGGSDLSTMAQAQNAGLIDLEGLYNRGVTSKYEEMKVLLTKIQEQLDIVYTNLYKQKGEQLENAKGAIASGADQWKRLRAEIMSKYVNTQETRINEKAAYWLLSRAQYANWLSKKTDTVIVDNVVDALERFEIMKEAGVKEWNKGAGGKVARGLGWLLGNWASFGYDEKIEQLNKWGRQEIGRLHNQAVWQEAFA